MEWSAAERGELGASLLSAPSAPHGGGGDVSKMLAEFVKIVAALKRARGALRLDAAWALAEAVQACLRPPHAQTLTKAQARDFRTAWNTLQALSDGGESKASTRPSPPPMEIDASQSTAGDRGDRRQQLQLQDDVDDSYELQLEEERTQEITRLNSQVSTVNQIYRDIASLVGNQQTEVDEIENLVAQGHSRTMKGQAQLEAAMRKKTFKNKCCCYFAVFLAIFCVILVFAIIGFKRVGAAAV